MKNILFHYLPVEIAPLRFWFLTLMSRNSYIRTLCFNEIDTMMRKFSQSLLLQEKETAKTFPCKNVEKIETLKIHFYSNFSWLTAYLLFQSRSKIDSSWLLRVVAFSARSWTVSCETKPMPAVLMK
jgi:hypothetical protein